MTQEIQHIQLVSIILPTHNRCDILARCLDSLAQQTYSNYEIIVIDDGSTDHAPEFLKKFATDHPDLSFHVITNETNIGANASRNRGIAAAKGLFIAFIDSDCIAEPDWIEKLILGFVSDQVAAVVGHVIDPIPKNIYELAFKGTHRIHSKLFANRLVMGNMCIRHNVFDEWSLDEDRSTQAYQSDGTVDTTVSGRGDEEGLYLHIKASGHEQRVAHDAVVVHIHHYTGRSFFKQAYRSGKSAARFVYKYYLFPRLDMLPFILTYLTVPLIFAQPFGFYIPLFFFCAAMSAITYNDLFRKRKTIAETLLSYPVLTAYYHVRLTGYILESFRLRLIQNNIHRILLSNKE